MSSPNEPRFLILITTSTYRASAYLDAARRLDVPVTVGSERTQSLAMANPEGHLTLDFRDPEKASSEIAALARSQPVRAVVAPDDDGALLGAMASERLGLRGNPVDAVGTARDKLAMRQAIAAAGLLSPDFQSVSIDDDPARVAATTGYPCVLKPLFLSASRGVIRADDPRTFVRAFRRIDAILRRPEIAEMRGSRAGRVLVEGFIPGIEVAVEGLLTDGKLEVLAIYDKPDPLDGPFFEETILVTPSRHPDRIQSAIVDAVVKGVKALGLRHGPIHAELRINTAGPWIVEIAPRSIGGLCSRTLRFGEGISLEEMILRHAGGERVDTHRREERAAGVMMIPIPGAGVLEAIEGEDAALGIPDVEELRLTIPAGQTLVPPPEGDRYLGFIFARAGSPERVEQALREAHESLRFTVAALEDAPQGVR